MCFLGAFLPDFVHLLIPISSDYPMGVLANLSIKGKLILIILFVTLLALGIGLVIFFFIARATLRDDLKNAMVNSAKILADYSISPLEFNDRRRAAEILEKLNNEPQIECAQILTRENDVFAFYNHDCGLPENLSIAFTGLSSYEEGYLHVIQPVVDGNQSFGRVYIRASTAQMSYKIERLLLGILATMAGVSVIAVLVTLRLQRVISAPVFELTRATRRVSSGDYQVRAQKQHNDEIGELCEGFNYMLGQIELRQREEEKSKKALQLSESKFRNIYENSMVGIFRVSWESGELLEANTRTWEILNIQKGRSFKAADIISLRQMARLRSKVNRHEVVDSFEVIMEDREQQKTWLSVSGRLFREQNYFEGVIKDVTEEKESFLELKRVNFELDNFVYHTSHDLRSPLLSIMGLIDLCKQEDSLEGVMRYFDLIERSVKRLDALVINLLTLSRNSRVNDKKQLVDFAKLVKESVEILNLSKPESVKVTVDVVQETEFLSDPTRINIILNNLISNAFKYQNPPRDEPFVNISAEVTETEVVIKIMDNGMGISPESQPKIFQMFYRATDQSHGSGLGLYIVKNMVDKLKGSLSFTSAPRKGTTFVVKIPNALNG